MTLPSHCLLLCTLAGAIAAQDPIFDDFERHSLGPSWINFGGSSANIVNQSDLGVPNTSWCAVGWTATAFPADQFSEAMIAPDIDPNMLTQVFVRRRTSDLARYAFHYNGERGQSQWEIKYDGVPTAQTRILALLIGPGPLPGDTLRIEAQGQNPVILRGLHQGKLVLRAVDAAPQQIAGGVAGVVARMKQGTTNSPPTPIFESWSGGSLAWLDLGNGLAGTNGVPLLYGSGVLQAGQPIAFAATGALPGSAGALALGLARLDLPILGGVLVPQPQLVIAGIPLDAQGQATLGTLWPAGTPSGFSAYAQLWIADAGAPLGFAATNGLEARVP